MHITQLGRLLQHLYFI